MASAQTVAQLVAYYVNLLIVQYAGQPNAQAEIALLAETALANAVFLDVENAYNIIGDNTAVGAQLDIIGKYVGVDRFYSELELTNYSGLVTYSEHSSLPTPPTVGGLTTYATFGNYDYNGTLQYSDIIATNNELNDANFLTLIKLGIINNNSNFSAQSIDASLFSFFGTAIRAESIGGAHLVYFITAALTPLIQAIIAKGLLPAPMGVGTTIVSDITGPMFSLVTYGGPTSPFGSGCSTYSDYATLPGETLTYAQIS